MKLPDKVRVGEKLSARWLNQVVDCLKELAKAANMQGNGTSSSSIEYSGSDYRDTKYRGTGGTDLQEFRVVPFQLRLKPKHLCEVSADGNWPKIAQIKAGAVIDYMGKTHPVPKGAAIYDYTEGWIDLGAFSETLTKIYCIIKQNYKGEVLSAEFKKAEAPFVPWGKTEANQKGEGTLSVFIGSYQLRKINEVNRAHIYQAHCGTLDLQTIQVEKLFDEDEEAGTSNGSGENGYYTAPESEEYESKPAGLFRKREEHLLIFKKLICGEGLSLDGEHNLKIKLRRANSVWPDGSGSTESLASDEPIITLGGVEDIVFSNSILMPEIENGIIRIPYADTLKEVTGVISGLEVSYRAAILEDDGTVTFLGEDGSRLPQVTPAADQDGDSASGSGDGPYINEIVDGVIYITIPIFQEGSFSMSLSASESASDSESLSESLSASDDETNSDEESASESASLSASASESESASASASASGSDSASMSESASGSASTSDSSSGSASASGSSSQEASTSVESTSENPPSVESSSWNSGSTDTPPSAEESSPGGSSSQGGSTPGGSIPGGGSEGSSGGGSSSVGSGCCGCDCAAKLAELEKQIAELSKRLDEMEKKECTCKCGNLLGQIQAAVAAEAQAIASGINYEVSVNGAVVTTTEYGTIVADTTGSISANGGNASSSIHYQ